ncbi:MAG: FliM/FliN family flagellar motor switch protein [Sedimentisphaerales bacterium]|nr:FliM/FliN family flagellar motor switch protein [Sedimentisphaerales bacterium]
MRDNATHNLSKKRIRQLLASIGSKPMEETDAEETAEYNWHEPQSLTGPQLDMLDGFVHKLATALADKFSSFCRSKFNATIASTTFHFASEFLKPAAESQRRDFCLPFARAHERVCGFIGLPEQTAIVWARQLLGDSESGKDSDVTLSQLEESLLWDLISSFLEVFSTLHAGADFRPEGDFVKDQWPLKVHETDELCRISFDVNKAGSEETSHAYLMILCEELNSVVGKAAQTSGMFSPEEISKANLNHLQVLPITIAAQLDLTELTFREIANLQVNDILLLDKTVDQPVDLIVGNRIVYYGWPVKSSGKYAVSITSSAFGETS